MTYKVISLGRAKYRRITLTPFKEINKNLIIFDDYFFSLVKSIIFGLNHRNDDVEIIFCDGNNKTLNFKILCYLIKNIETSYLWLNSLNEINKSNNFNLKHYYFFPEQEKFINKKFKKIIPFPKILKLKNNREEFFLSYISEVIIDIKDNSYVLINNLKANDVKKIDNFAWRSLREKNFDKISSLDYSFNFVDQLILSESYENKLFLSNEVYRLIKNRLRYVCIVELYKKFKNEIYLVGKTWKNLGFDTIRNNYDYFDNRNIYSNSLISFDCGSTSGENPIYLRTYEIILNSSCLFQSMTSMSEYLYGDLKNKICFINLEDMVKKLNNLRNLEKEDFEILKEKTFQKLKSHSFSSL